MISADAKFQNLVRLQPSPNPNPSPYLALTSFSLLLSTDFADVVQKVTEIGPQEDEWGFSSAKEIPDT